jgi:hypothetical protein
MYASRTGTRRNLAVLRAAGWRLLVSARGVHRAEGFPYAIDNGAWTAYQKGEPFDVPAFESLVEKLGAGADWIALPDVVGGGLESLRLSMSWASRLKGELLLPVQDGMAADDVRAILGPEIGIFLGGSTAWKLDTMRSWGELARSRGCHFHVARVNTRIRIRRCHEAGADSTDGSSVSRFAKTLPMLDAEANQGGFVW